MDPEKAKKSFPALAQKIIGRDFRSQAVFDRFLIALDGTPDKHKLGGNVMLGLSLAWARLKAQERRMELHQYIQREMRDEKLEMRKKKFPHLTSHVPYSFFNMLNGGAHATHPQSRLSFQEFLVIPEARDSRTAFVLGKKFYGLLHRALIKRFGKKNIRLGDEGGFSAPFRSDEEALDILASLIKKHHLSLHLGLDCAATAFSKSPAFANAAAGRQMANRKWQVEDYVRLVKKYNLLSVEDPFGENDGEGFRKLTAILARYHSPTLVVADDLTTTNPRRIEWAANRKLATAVIIKPNQIGTLTEAIQAVSEARRGGWKIIASHRSGETLDSFISDFAVGVGAWGIKAGAPATPERLAKYNRLVTIEANI